MQSVNNNINRTRIVKLSEYLYYVIQYHTAIIQYCTKKIWKHDILYGRTVHYNIVTLNTMQRTQWGIIQLFMYILL